MKQDCVSPFPGKAICLHRGKWKLVNLLRGCNLVPLLFWNNITPLSIFIRLLNKKLLQVVSSIP